MPVGTIVIERRLLITNIEEMIAAAPRLVDSLVHNKPIDATVDMETVTEAVGGLYFFNKQNTSPYIGGSITAARAWVDEDNQFNRGMGFYVAGGLQMLRTTQNRLKLELRVDSPLFSLPSQDIMPITIGLFFSRHYVPGQSGCCLF